MCGEVTLNGVSWLAKGCLVRPRGRAPGYKRPEHNDIPSKSLARGGEGHAALAPWPRAAGPLSLYR